MKIYLLLIQILFCSLTLANDNPLEILQQMNFTIVDSVASDFKLEKVKGGESSLKEYRGKWVWLTFWATWCGPCRQELPELESLYQKFKDQKFVIVGVSIDDGPKSQVASFVKDLGINFPILLDPHGDVASKYQASAVPLIYVISPEGKVVGIFQGATSWDTPQVNKNLQQLVKIDKLPDNLDLSKLKNNGGELPNNLTPPKLQLVVGSNSIRANKKFTVEVLITWDGDARKYSLKTPVLNLPIGVEQGDISSVSSSNQDSAVLRYQYPLTIKKSGRYQIGPVELSYRPRVGGQELFARVGAIDVVVKDNNFVIFTVGGLTLLLLLILAGLLFYKRSLKNKITALPKKDQIDQSLIIERIKKLKFADNAREYQIELLKFIIDNFQDSEDLLKIKELIEEIRYAGRELTHSQISYYEKLMDRCLKENNLDMEA